MSSRGRGLADAKRAVRMAMRAAVRAMPRDEVERQSEEVAAALVASEAWRGSRAVCAFLSMRDELSTEAVVRAAFRDGKRLYVPRVEGPREMRMLEARGPEDVAAFTPSAWGIPEPPGGGGRRTAGSDPDLLGGAGLVVLPGVAYEASGARLGQGRGYYDTWLAALAGRARERGGTMPRLVGVCLAPQLLPDGAVPAGGHDWKVDEVVAASAAGQGVAAHE